jgi:hypothetical protein
MNCCYYSRSRTTHTHNVSPDTHTLPSVSPDTQWRTIHHRIHSQRINKRLLLDHYGFHRSYLIYLEGSKPLLYPHFHEGTVGRRMRDTFSDPTRLTMS